MYILDNEPSLWWTNHRDVHPEPLSYDELVQRTIDYGTAIREADPEAVIAGPAEWGWTNYFYSPKDQAAGPLVLRPDRRAHGDFPLVAYYLKALAEHQKKTGVRVLDVFDLHAYPTADNVYGDAVDRPRRRAPGPLDAHALGSDVRRRVVDQGADPAASRECATGSTSTTRAWASRSASGTSAARGT